MEGCVEGQARPGQAEAPPLHLGVSEQEDFSWDMKSQRRKMRMPARRQMLAQGWRDRKPSNVRWAGEPGLAY